jgi:hypothetical protein
MVVSSQKGRYAMDKRLYPVSVKLFETEIKPLIDKCYSAAGRPQKISDYECSMPFFTCSAQEFLGGTYQKATDIGTLFTYASTKAANVGYGVMCSKHYSSASN